MFFWCLWFLQKSEQKQVNLRYHSSKVEFVCSFFFFWRIVGLKKSLRLCLTFSFQRENLCWESLWFNENIFFKIEIQRIFLWCYMYIVLQPHILTFYWGPMKIYIDFPMTFLSTNNHLTYLHLHRNVKVILI